MNRYWKRQKVGEILRLEYGKPLLKEQRNPDGAFPVYGSNGVLAYSEKFYVDQPSIIVGRKGSAGELMLTEPKFWPLDVTYFVEFNNNKHDLKFLFYLLKSLDLPGLAKGVKPGINRNDVYEIEVNTPPLPEQRRIVALLDHVFETIDLSIENTKRNLENIRELFQSSLNDVFIHAESSWEIKQIVEVCKVIAGQSPKGKFYNNSGQGLPFYQGKKEFTDKYIGKPTTWTTSVTKEAQKEDILMSVRAPVGPVNFSTERICIGRGLAAIRALSSLDKEYLFYFFLKNRNEITGNVGAVFNSISKTQIEKIFIPLPPLSIQGQIVTKLDVLCVETNKLADNYRKKLTGLEELRQSLLHKAFAGEL